MAWIRWKSALVGRRYWGTWTERVRRLNPWKGLAALGVLGGLIWLGAQAAGSVQTARRAFPVESGRVSASGLHSAVSILRDARGIPHIEALTERDAWQALGFAHAQDRLAQMLWLRRLARGETAEIVGESGLAADRLARTLGLRVLAEREMEGLAAEARDVLNAYAAGVNVRIEGLRSGGDSPPILLREGVDAISDWRSADSLAILKLIAWSSGNQLETGVVLDELIRVLGGGLAAPFRPGGIDRVGAASGDSLPEPRVSDPSKPPRGLGGVASRELSRSTRIGGGSAWVLAGRHTESGRPFLVADLNLPATAPSLVYEAHLQSPDMNVVGATIPGLPLFWIGRNLEVAWAAIPAGAVTVDLYLETVREKDGVYHDGARWAPLTVRSELIRVRQASGFRDEEITIRATRHGPLIDSLLGQPGGAEGSRASGEGYSAENPPIALAWTGREAGDGFSSLLAVTRAEDAGELRAALATHHEPVVAVVYADATGAAGVQLAGWLPQRSLPSGLVPVPARMGIYDWRGPIPYAELPSVRMDASEDSSGAGARSWVAFSDGKIDDGLNVSGIEWLWRPGERARRLVQRLAELTEGGPGAGSPVDIQRADLRTAAAIQGDLGVSNANEVVPAILRLARIPGPLSPEAEEIADLLSRWDGQLGADSPGAAAYSVLNSHLFAALFEAELGEALCQRYLGLPGVRPAVMAGRILLAADRSRSAGGWADLERVVAGLRESLRLTWVTLTYRLGPSRADWLWGELHGLEFRPFAGTRSASQDGSQGFRRVGVGGGVNTLASSTSGSQGFEVVSASSYRLAVDLASPDRLLSSLAPGQSEHPRHPHALDGARRWLEGRPKLLLTSRLHVEEESAAPLLLEPAR